MLRTRVSHGPFANKNDATLDRVPLRQEPNFETVFKPSLVSYGDSTIRGWPKGGFTADGYTSWVGKTAKDLNF